MSVPLIIPDHVKQARRSLLCAGYKCDIDDPAFAALMFVAIAYNRIPQVNIAEMLRQEVAQTKYEMGRVVNDLLTENNRVKRLQDEVRRLRAQVGLQALDA